MNIGRNKAKVVHNIHGPAQNFQLEIWQCVSRLGEFENECAGKVHKFLINSIQISVDQEPG